MQNSAKMRSLYYQASPEHPWIHQNYPLSADKITGSVYYSSRTYITILTFLAGRLNL